MIPCPFARAITLASATVVIFCSLAHAQQQHIAAAPEIVTESVTLRFCKPSEMVRYFMRPDPDVKPGTGNRSFITGLKQFVPNDVTGTVTLSASAATLKEFKALIGFLDIAPRTLRLKIRLLRYKFAAGAKTSDDPKITEIANTEMDAINNTSVELSFVAGQKLFYGNVVPHVNGDESVSLAVKMRITDEPEDIEWKSVPGIYRTVGDGKKLLFLHRGAGGAKVLMAPDSSYERLEGINSGYYLEVMTLVNPAAGQKGKTP